VVPLSPAERLSIACEHGRAKRPLERAQRAEERSLGVASHEKY
jgi:hypothetical protein